MAFPLPGAGWGGSADVENGKRAETCDLSQGAAIALFLFPVLVGVAALMLRLAKRAETV